MKNEIWVIEHSNIQNCFHVDLLTKVLENNTKNMYEKGASDYQIIYYGTRAECDNYLLKLLKN